MFAGQARLERCALAALLPTPLATLSGLGREQDLETKQGVDCLVDPSIQPMLSFSLSSSSSSSSLRWASRLRFFVALSLLGVGSGGDPYVYYQWEVSYISASPLGVRQQVIAINGQFPGPVLSATTNWNAVVDIQNNLDEPFLVTWNGLQQRKNSWQDGVSGTNCPIPSGWNWTYEFQVKDQIGSFFYFPSINFQNAAGGYGGIIIYNRDVIPLPFGLPDGDITIFISDWTSKKLLKMEMI